jgi:hypothetical protein
MTLDELIDRIQARGGQLRVRGARLQYRPAGVLSPAEVAWLGHHHVEVRAALTQRERHHPAARAAAPERDVRLDDRPMGEAGPGVPAWHCSIDRGTGHVSGLREDGSTFCATCHPGAVAGRGALPT